MNVNQIIDMIVRTVMRQLIHRGVSAGIDKVAQKSRPAGPPGPSQRNDPGGANREDVRQMREARRAARQAREDKHPPQG